MTNYRRIHTPGASIFFTVCLEDRGSDLLIREIDTLRHAFRSTMAERPFVIDAIVVLPDHLHTILTLPRGDSDYATRWAVIKSRFTRSVPKVTHKRPSQERRCDGGIWQRRFWEHHLRNEADYQAHKDYCLTDPVRHGLTRRPEDWLYSSIHREMDDKRPTIRAIG